MNCHVSRLILLALAVAWFVGVGASAPPDTEERTIANPNTGRMTLLLPRDWLVTPAEDEDTGTSVLRVSPPKKEFDLEIVINGAAALGLEALTPRDLETFIKEQLEEEVQRAVESDIAPRRFGTERDGVYARLTDAAPKPDEYLFVSKGVRLIGRNVVLFSLYSNDTDGEVLKQALAAIESVRPEKRGTTRPKDLI